MKRLTLELTLEELKLLASLASDQLFRKEFIDPRMPGHQPNPAEVNLGKTLVGRLRVMVAESSPKKGFPARGTGWRSGQASSNGSIPSPRT